MKALVTGAGGFAGRRLAPRLRADGYEIVALDRASCDLRDFARVRERMEAERPDFVVHLASRAHPGSRSPEEFRLQAEHTVAATLNVALAAPPSTKLAVFVGSIEEYGAAEAPFRETQEPLPFSAYGWAKIAAHAGARTICRAAGLPFVWLRPSLLYGPGMSSDRFLGALIKAQAEGAELKLTPGDQVRDFLFVDDFCEMIARILRNPEAAARSEVFNLSTEGRRRIREVVADLERVAGAPSGARLGALPYRESEAMEFWSSGAKFREAFGAIDATPFEEGLRQAWEAASARFPRTVSTGIAGTQAPQS